MRICSRCLRSFRDTERFCPKDGGELLDGDEVSRNAANATFDALPADLGKEARRNVFERLESPTLEVARKDIEARLAGAEAIRTGGGAKRGIGSVVAVVGVVVLALLIAAGFFVLLAPAPKTDPPVPDDAGGPAPPGR